MKPLSKDEYISNQAEFRFSIQTFNSISYVSHLIACNYTYNFMLCSLDFTSFISRFIWTHIHNELPINTILYAYYRRQNNIDSQKCSVEFLCITKPKY